MAIGPKLIVAEQMTQPLTNRELAGRVEDWPVLSATVEDLDEVRLAAYFRSRFPNWKQPDDWRTTLRAHKLAIEWSGRLTPTHTGVLLFSDEPNRFIPGAYIEATDHQGGSPEENRTGRRCILGGPAGTSRKGHRMASAIFP